MEQIQFAIPWAFINARLTISWKAILYGIEHELAAPSVPVEAATDRLGDAEDCPPALLELAIAKADEPVRHLVQTLAAAEESAHDTSTRETWLYLVMAWVYEHRSEMDDPLGVVERIYADFDYPESILGLVRYMPSDMPDLGSPEANEDRLMQCWELFLADERTRLHQLAE